MMLEGGDGITEAPMAPAASHNFSSPPRWTILFCMVLVAGDNGPFLANAVGLGSRILAAKGGSSWVSENGTFAFGFTPMDHTDRFQLAIWFAELPGDRTLVWSANRNAPVGKNSILELDASGNLVLIDGNAIVWMSNTSGAGVETAVMSETGNLMLLDSTPHPVWQSFSHPSDTLLPTQPLTASQELTSYSTSPSHGGYYTLKMLQQHTSLSLALTYNLPQSHANVVSSPNNYSYWSGPDISNVTGDVIAVLDPAGSFGIVYGDSSDGAGAVYVYKNDADQEGLSSARNRSDQKPTGKSLRRLILEANGNIRLYRWDVDYNRSQQWVPEWAALSNPCEIAGTCGDGICNLDRTKTNATCASLPVPEVLSPPSRGNACRTTAFKMRTMQQTTYHFTTTSVIANYSDVAMVSKCGEACLSDCECVASVYGLSEETPYCWVLRSLEFGGFEDAGSTLFLKVRNDGSAAGPPLEDHGRGRSRRDDKTVLVLPIVLCFSVLIGLLCSLLYYSVHRRRRLKRAMKKYSLVVLGNPIGFTFRDLQCRTSNFSELLGTGGFGSVYKGSLGDGTLIAVKKLDKVLPHGEKEFIAEVNTIGSMHHMNLVRLCGYCSEGSQRLLVYEFMKNGSLDRWIFPSNYRRDRLLDWPTRLNIAVGTAQGVAYFHEQCRNRIIHCDIKPENILLDDNFCPKVSDFGLAKLMMGREHSHVVTMVRGTRGYLAPEWVSNRPITVKADVYSYGMLLLEIIGGRRNLDMSFDAEDFFYPGLAYKEMINGTALKAADKRLGGAVEEEELMRALQVAFWCIQDEVFMRPSMGDVVKMLQGSAGVNRPPMPQTVLELMEEGLAQVYRAMKRDFNHPWSSFATTAQPSSHATCSCSSIMSPR